MPNYKKRQNINFCPNQHPLPHRQDKTSLCPHISTQWDIISQSEVRICFGPLPTRGPSERNHQIFDSLLDFALTKQSVVRMLMSSSVSPSSHSSTSVVLVIGDLSKYISKVAYKLVLLTKCEEKTVPTTQLTQGYQSCCQPSFQLSTLRTSYPSPLGSNVCAALSLWNYVHSRSTIFFSSTNLVRRTREADRDNFVWVQKDGWIHFDGCKILSPRLPCYTFHLVNINEYVKQHNQIKKH